jgi:hypothetical protein
MSRTDHHRDDRRAINEKRWTPRPNTRHEPEHVEEPTIEWEPYETWPNDLTYEEAVVYREVTTMWVPSRIEDQVDDVAYSPIRSDDSRPRWTSETEVDVRQKVMPVIMPERKFIEIDAINQDYIGAVRVPRGGRKSSPEWRTKSQRFRVWELAHHVGLDSKVVIETLRWMGEYVKGAQSTVELPVAIAVLDHLLPDSRYEEAL